MSRSEDVMKQLNFWGLGLTEVEKAYIAGFVDGEGCITLIETKRKDRGNNRLAPIIAIANTNKEGLEWIAKRLEVNRIVVTSKQTEKWKRGYQLKIEAINRVYEVLEAILPYLVIKKEQAQLVMGFISGHGNMQGKERRITANEYAMLERIRALNKKGSAT